MANLGPACVWNRYPEAWAFAVESRRKGHLPRAIVDSIRERFGLEVGLQAVEQKFRREGIVPEPSPLERLVAPAGGFALDAILPPKREHPKGWEPHVEEHGNTATAISQPLETANPDEADLIRGWNLDPALWRIVGPLNCRRWQAVVPVRNADGKVIGHEERWLYYYRANLERIDPVKAIRFAALEEEIASHLPVPMPPPGPGAFAVCIADPQMGKDDGDGPEGTTRRFLASIDRVSDRVRDLRAIGRPMDTLYVFGMGDLIENCDGHYAQQAHRVKLDLTEQINVMRRLILHALEQWSLLFPRVVVAAVGGNHGENRRDGKSFTTFADNHDVAIFHQLHDVLRVNPAAYGHISFVIPKGDLSLTLDVDGIIVGLTHGHVAGHGSAPPQKKLVDWWMKQAHGQQAIGDARILISAHYHHLLVTEAGAKTHIQCPALEGGSDWWRNQSGQESRKGMLTLRIGKNVSPSGWADLEVV
jgi:hypothetical protein